MIHRHINPDTVEWTVSKGLIAYPLALKQMEDRAKAIAEGTAPEQVWLLEHPPLYTAGTSADPIELLNPQFPVFTAGRGGRYTYHGPGQRVGYVMMNLAVRGKDVRCFVHELEGWMIAALADLNIDAWRAPGRIGIWTMFNGNEVKIGAIGVRVRRWVSFHGFAINVSPDLTHFEGIIPCGLPDYGVTSVQQQGGISDFDLIDAALSRCFPDFLKKISTTQKKT